MVRAMRNMTMSNPEQQSIGNDAQTASPKFQPPYWRATFRGQTLGYFPTADEAQDRVDLARAEADAEREYPDGA